MSTPPKKIMKSYEPKCHHWVPPKVNNLKANGQPQDGLMRHLSLGMQSFPLAATQHSMRRSFCQLARCSWTKPPTLPEYQRR